MTAMLPMDSGLVNAHSLRLGPVCLRLANLAVHHAEGLLLHNGDTCALRNVHLTFPQSVRKNASGPAAVVPAALLQ